MAEVISANGVEASLIWNSALNTFMARVYSADRKSFKDYNIWHCDLSVKIIDPDACFYEEGLRLDHAPETLGIKPRTQT